MRSIALALLTVALGASPLAAKDAANGEDVFKRCKACHQVGESAKNAVGPVLNGIFGRKAGTVEGFNYSEANKSSGVVWDEANFAKYIRDPRAAMPGNKMAFAGLKDDDDIADLVTYLKQFGPDGKTK